MTHKIRSLFLPLFALLLTVLACALPGASTPAPAPLSTAPTAPVPTAAPLAGTPATANVNLSPLESRFATFQYRMQTLELPASQGQGFNDVKVELLQGLSTDQRKALLTNGFIVIPTPFNNFNAAYRHASEQKLPPFISADLILYHFQLLADVVWQQVEAGYLAADLRAFSEGMAAASLAQWETAGEGLVAEAAWQNLAYFSIGSRLLNPEFEVPPAVVSVVDEELTLIQQGGVFVSPLFQRQQDYGAYSQVRARDGQNDEVEDFLQAMLWYAQPLFLDGPDPVATRTAALQALLMGLAAEASENVSRWDRVYQPVAYFKGNDGAWSLLEVLAAADAVYGTQQALPTLADPARLDNFIATLDALPRPAALDTQPPKKFSLMPFAAYADEAILREMIFNRVGPYTGDEQSRPATAIETQVGTIRALPRALDVPAVLGSELALSLVQATGDATYDGYLTQLERLQRDYASFNQADWTQTAGSAWLYSVQPLLETPRSNSPPFMQSEAWHHKQLNTWYATWIELRHDTVLAPRPVEALDFTADGALGYVEPQPVLYGRLAATTRQMIEGLDARGLLDKEMGQKLLYMERLLNGLDTISRKELNGEHLNADEALLITQILQRLSSLTTFAPTPDGTVPLTDTSLPRIVDVYQDGTSGKLLQGAAGEVWPIYVVVPQDTGPVVTMGAIYSTYELLGEQLRATDWQSMTERPAPAAWASLYVTP